MNYRCALVLADLHADPAAALAALRVVATAPERVVIVARLRRLATWWSSEPFGEPDARELETLELWRAAAAEIAPCIEVRHAPGLTLDALVDLAITEHVELLVAGTCTLDSTSLLLRAARRLSVAVVWPAGEARAAPARRVFCSAIGRRAGASIYTFLRKHADPSLEVAIVGPEPLPADQLAADLQVLGIDARIEVIPRSVHTLRAVLAIAARSGPVDLVVLTRVSITMLLSHTWPAPVLLVPQAIPSGAHPRALDMTDVIDLEGTCQARIEEVTAVATRTPATHLPVAFVSGGQVVATESTNAWGEVEFSPGVSATWVGAVRVQSGVPPDPLAALEQRFTVIRPSKRPLVLFDARLSDDRLRILRDVSRATSVEPLAVRLRPNIAAAAIRRRLQAAGLPPHVVDARAALDEGAAYDVGEKNDPVRLRRVAARMRAFGFAVTSVFDSDLETPEPLTVEPAVSFSGNRIEIELDNGQARTFLLDEIARSRESVNMQVYMVSDDEVGKAVEAALVGAAARGVTTRVLVDSLHGLHGSFGAENALLSRLSAHPGIELRVSRPITRLPSLADLKERDHRKLVIVDGRIALIGGRNFAHEYYTRFEEVRLTAATTSRQVPWLDSGARIEGPAVAAIAASFLEAWTSAGGAPFAIDRPAEVGSSSVSVVVHRGLRDARTLEAYRGLIEQARSHLYVVNGFPYVLELQNALVRAVRRGVRVQVISGHLMPTHDGVPFAGPWSSARTVGTEFVHSRFDPIVDAGGEVYLFARRWVPGWDAEIGVVQPHVHAKLVSADGLRCAVGSANLDVTSAYWESELMLIVEDATVTTRLERSLDELIAGSTKVLRDDPTWREHARRRTWMQKWPGVLVV